MSKSVMISLLDQGQTGSEILQILDSMVENQDDQQPTSEEIDF